MTEKDTFFGEKHAIERNPGKLPIIDTPFYFDPSVEAGPSRQHGTLQKFFESYLSLARDSYALVKLETLLHHPYKAVKDSAVNSLQKRKTGKETRMNIQIGDYEVESIILDLGSDVNILTNKTWQLMGNPALGWSPVQLRLANQAKVQPIGHISNLVVDIEGMKMHAEFDVIEVVKDGGSYPTLLGIGWDNDSIAVINFKK